MTQLKLELDLDNDAFAESRDDGIVDTLRDLARRMEVYPGDTLWTLTDVNGNQVGRAEIIECADYRDVVLKHD